MEACAQCSIRTVRVSMSSREKPSASDNICLKILSITAPSWVWGSFSAENNFSADGPSGPARDRHEMHNVGFMSTSPGVKQHCQNVFLHPVQRYCSSGTGFFFNVVCNQIIMQQLKSISPRIVFNRLVYLPKRSRPTHASLHTS